MSECPVLRAKPTPFAMHRPTAYSQKRKFRPLPPISPFRQKRSFELSIV